LYVSHVSEWSITDVQSYWSDITPAVVITIGLVLIFVINMLNVKM
jgi:amino acid permease